MTETTPDHDVLIVGAGFAGMYLLHKFREMGKSALILEKADGVGGTWYWNRYPGARCDIESMEYSYSWDSELQQDWDWSERYSAQPEILEYANHVADRFDLRRDIRFDTKVTSAHYDEAANIWHIGTDDGESRTARFLVMATGCLSEPNMPDIPGKDDFEGSSYLTGLWPHEGVDFTGQRVGVIGTGSSAIQSIPQIAKQAKELVVFQRTPNFAIPAHNDELTDEYRKDAKAKYDDIREQARMERAGFIGSDIQTEDYALDLDDDAIGVELQKRWDWGGLRFMTSYADMGVSLEANAKAAEFVRGKIREKVKDPELAEKLCPDSYPIGTKRLCVDIDYYEIYNLDHVHLVDLRETPIETITAKGIKTSEREFEFDAIVFATGFDAMTGTLAKIDIRGRDGGKLKDKWADGPRTYLGLMTVGFPNLFLVTGPQSPSVISNMLVSIEQHVDWIADCIARVGDGWIEATEKAEADWVEHSNMVANLSIYPYANSWYMGANIPGKPRIFTAYIGGVGEYRQICDAVAERGYAGFTIDGEASNGTVDPLEFLEVNERLMELAAQREPVAA